MIYDHQTVASPTERSVLQSAAGLLVKMIAGGNHTEISGGRER